MIERAFPPTEVTGNERWVPMDDLLILREAMETGGQKLTMDAAVVSTFAGIHCPPGETWYFERTIRFRIVGP